VTVSTVHSVSTLKVANNTNTTATTLVVVNAMNTTLKAVLVVEVAGVRRNISVGLGPHLVQFVPL